MISMCEFVMAPIGGNVQAPMQNNSPFKFIKSNSNTIKPPVLKKILKNKHKYNYSRNTPPNSGYIP